MTQQVRKLGIDAMSEAPWGTHLCQFYQTKEDLVDILVPYFKTGLENNEFCMWVTSGPLTARDAKTSLGKVLKNLDDYVKKGQIEILDHDQWYTKSGKFEPDRVLQGWLRKQKRALKRGFDGLRLTGNTFWLEQKDWRDFKDYEATVDNMIGKYQMIAICSYCLDKCGASQLIDVVSNHQFALIRRSGKWELIQSAERKRAQEALHQSEREMRIRNRITEIFLTSSDDAMYGDVLQVVLEALESKYGTFAYIDENGDRVVPSMTRGIWDKCKIRRKDIFFPRETWGNNLWARCITEKRGIFSNGPFRVPNGHIPITRALAVPIIHKGDVIGNFMVGNKATDYDERDKELLETVAGHTAPILYAWLQREKQERERNEAQVALKKARDELEQRVQERTAELEKANEQLSREIEERKRAERDLRSLSSRLLHVHEEESRRIGQELHDGLAQTLSAIKVWLEAAAVQVSRENIAEVVRSLEHVIPLAQGGVEEVRRISLNLRPSMLDDLGILAAISWLCQDFEATYPGIGIKKQIDIQDHDVPEPLKITVFRVTQEALNNIAKHSQANLVHLSLRRIAGNKIEFTITDDGIGFDLNHAFSGVQFGRGLGLDNMRERTELSNGSFTIESNLGAGTTVRAIWQC